MLIDGGSGGAPVRRSEAREQLEELAGGSPFLDLSGFGLPWAIGVLNAVGSTLAVQEPDAPAVLAAWQPLPGRRCGRRSRPPTRPATATRSTTTPRPPTWRSCTCTSAASPPAGDPRPWADGELGTVARAAEMFSGIEGIDGTAWYHPRRLSLDGQAVAGGVANPAQRLLGVRATHGRDLELPIYAIETSLGAGRVLKGARALARRSDPRRMLTLVDRHTTYDHLDPLSAVRGRERVREDRHPVPASGEVASVEVAVAAASPRVTMPGQPARRSSQLKPSMSSRER